tara:strand:+ start:694 stop:921 length:228 start_codon:yes stop_codon:yes gene_type:complete
MTDIIIHNLQEQLDRIESKIDGHLKKDWLSTSDVKTETGFSSTTIHRAIKKGQLQVSRANGKNMFKREWIERWLK